jgi:hypothetical protein
MSPDPAPPAADAAPAPDPAGDPLDQVLRAAADAGDPLVAAWARRLLGGEAAGGRAHGPGGA